MNGVQTRLKCKPNVKRCKRFVFAAHSPLLHPNTLKTKAIIHFQTDHILTRFVFPPLDGTGFFYSDESIAKSGLTYEGVGTPEPGDFIYKDLNGDGVINDRDKAPIGYSSLLPRINYGFSLSANWKGFDVSIMLQGVGQYSKTYSGAGIYESSGNFYKMHMERWSEERYNNHEKITYPRLSSSGGPSLQPNDFFIMDASYIRLKNAEVGYTLPESISKKIGASNVRFYLSGNNLYTWTHLKTDSFDPEQNSPAAYPTMRTYNVGLNITF